MRSRRSGFVAATVLGGALVAGCTGSGDSPPPTSSSSSVPPVSSSTSSPTSASSSSTSTASSPSSSATVALPPAATKKTPEGAEAFARFYLKQYSAAANAGDAALLDGLSTSKCRGCVDLQNLVRDLQAKGQHMDIDALKVGASMVSDVQDEATTVNVLAEDKPKKILDRNGAVVANVKGARMDVRMVIEWKSNRWAISDLGLAS